MKILVKGGQLVDPSQEINEIRTLYIEDGKSRAIHEALRN